MTDVETRYAQIKIEALVLTWACEKLSPYMGMTVQLETNHKPLVPLLSHTHLDNLYTTASTMLLSQADAVQLHHLSRAKGSYYMLW